MNRRKFVQLGTLSTGASVWAGCERDSQKPVSVPAGRRSKAEGLSREQVGDLSASTARAKLAICHHCAQSTFLALQEVFGLGGDEIVKALTPMPGIAERGETCGAVTGSLMALGLVFGRDRVTDWDGWRASLVPARAFCDRFEAKFGSTACKNILERQFGQRFDLYNEEDHRRFLALNPTEKCGEVVGVGSRIAAEIIQEA